MVSSVRGDSVPLAQDSGLRALDSCLQPPCLRRARSGKAPCLRRGRQAASSLQPLGFTLVELLIAATMISILFVGLGAHLRGGITVWHRATVTTERLQRERVALEQLERDFGNAVIYDDRETSYGEEAGKLPRPDLSESALAWFSVSPATPQRLAAVRFVTYRCAQTDAGRGLWRTAQSIGEARARREPTPQLVLPDCEQLTLRYGALPSDPSKPVEWRPRWETPEKGLPRLVEATIQFVSGSRITRLFSIPIGVSAPGAPSS